MTLYRKGSNRPGVERIQVHPKELGCYFTQVDSDFGGGTESAVRVSQSANGISVDEVVTPRIWEIFIPQEEIHAPAIIQKSLAYRCLVLNGAFKTSCHISECFAHF